MRVKVFFTIRSERRPGMKHSILVLACAGCLCLSARGGEPAPAPGPRLVLADKAGGAIPIVLPADAKGKAP